MSENLKSFPEILKIRRLLPIGSVVKIKGEDKLKYMIISNVMKHDEDGETKAYEYMACVYPVGFVDNESHIFFDDESITDIYSIGYTGDKEFDKRIITQNVLAGKKLHINK